MQEIEHVKEVIKKAITALDKEDSIEIRSLSNQTIHDASIYQDPDNVAIAVVLYALSKILERGAYREEKGWKQFIKAYRLALTKGVKDIERDDLEHYRIHIEEIRTAIRKIGGALKKYVDDVFRRAKVNKASRLHEHGLSTEKTAKILGITLWELNQYIGTTGIADVNLAYTKDLDTRIKAAEDIFK